MNEVKMKNKYIFRYLFFINLLLISCSTTPYFKTTETINKNIESPMVKPSESQIPVQSIEECIPLKEISNMNLDGAITTEGGEDGSLYVRDMQTFKVKKIRSTHLSNYAYAVSPDQSLQAMIDSNKLIIFNALGEIVKTITLDNDITGAGTIQWTSRNIVQIENLEVIDQLWIASSIITINLTTGERIKYPVILPPSYDKYGANRLLQWYDYLHFSLSPTLTHLVFEGNTNDEFLIRLWDIENKKIILRLPADNFNNLSFPQWSSDGSFFVINIPAIGYIDKDDKYHAFNNKESKNGSTQLFLVRINGSVEQLTNFSSSGINLEMGYSLSPDGRKVAFWLRQYSTEEETKTSLAIIDLGSREVQNFCLDMGNSEFAPKPIWSPDNKYLLVTQENYLPYRSTKLSIVDIDNRLYMKVADNEIGEGWIINRNK